MLNKYPFLIIKTPLFYSVNTCLRPSLRDKVTDFGPASHAVFSHFADAALLARRRSVDIFSNVLFIISFTFEIIILR